MGITVNLFVYRLLAFIRSMPNRINGFNKKLKDNFNLANDSPPA